MIRNKDTTLRTLTTEQADVLAEMMYKKLGPELSGMISQSPVNPNHLFRFLHISQVCKTIREEKKLSVKDISKALKIPQYKLKYIEENSLNNIDPEILDKYIDYLGLRSEFGEWLKNNRDVYEELGKEDLNFTIMLVIKRKLNEKIQIGEYITVQVVKFHDDKVFLNITLPNGDVKCEVVSKDEEIHISEDVVIMARVIQDKCHVRIGITAPKSMFIKRIPK